MRILIVSYFYYPESTPRAYRAFELVEELKKEGHIVDILTCQNEAISYNENNINLVKPGFFLNRNKNFNPSSQGKLSSGEGFIQKTLKKGLCFYNRILGGRTIEGAYYMYRWLKANSMQEYDLCISIGLPFCSHLATSFARKKGYLRTKRLVFDYGDSYYKNKHMQLFYTAFKVEEKCLKQVDAVTVPIVEALGNFNCFNQTFSLSVIPQGFYFEQDEFDTINLKPLNNKPSIVFAGNFYKGIRNPIPFFKKIKQEGLIDSIEFTFFTDLTNSFNENVCLQMTEMGFKLGVNPFIPRNKLIKELSQHDILLNIGNADPTALPSKLIDYGLSKRPILTIDENLDDAIALLYAFIDGNYERRTVVDLDKYHISNVTKQFLKLGV